MKQEDKDLLLQDLCGRLPYGVKVSVNQSQLQNYDYKWKNWGFEEGPQELDGVSIYGVTFGCMDMSDGVIGFEFIKPYLFPLSSMKEEQLNDFYAVIRPVIEESLREYGEWKKMQEGNPTGKKRPITLKDIACDITAVNWMLERYFDIYGLIEKGLAVDATGLNIYKNGTE